MSRDWILHRIRTATGRSAGQEPAPAPPPLLKVERVSQEERIAQFGRALEAVNGQFHRASSAEDARAYVSGILEGRPAVASGARLLADCGVTSLPGVRAGITDRAELLRRCAGAAVGITGADYALADTGTLVLFSSPEEARCISLLPPVHVALVQAGSLLAGLDELLALEPAPARRSSSMVLISGPSRTSDIEQVVVRGVHGPASVHVVLL